MARPRPLTPAPSAPASQQGRPVQRDVAPQSDMECWLRAAWPPGQRQGLDVARIAGDLGCSPSSVRRWLARRQLPTADLRRYLARRAILRGHGIYLWPAPGAVTVERDDDAAALAARSAQMIGSQLPDVWVSAGWDQPHHVHLLWWPEVHVFVAHVSGPNGRHISLPVLAREGDDRSGSAGGSRQMVASDHNGDVGEIKGALAHHAVIAASIPHANRHVAVAGMHQLLGMNADRRCVVPESLVPQGRTHALRGPLSWMPTLP